MTPADAVPASFPAHLTFGLRFVPHSAGIEAPSDPGGTPMLQNVVALPPQLVWLCQRAANGALLLDPGTYAAQGGYPVAPFATLLDGLLAALGPRTTDLGSPAGRQRLSEGLVTACSTIGTRVRVDLADVSFEGTATGISPEGHLIVASDGVTRTVVAGDVVHVRPDN